MTTLAKVLLVGNDRTHLEARATVLQHFWTVGTSALNQSGISESATDLIVFCHTIPAPERQEWINTMRHALPSALIVKMNGYDSGPHAGADATVDVAHGPGALVSTIYELVTERGLSSREWPQDAHDELPASVS